MAPKSKGALAGDAIQSFRSPCEGVAFYLADSPLNCNSWLKRAFRIDFFSRPGEISLTSRRANPIYNARALRHKKGRQCVYRSRALFLRRRARRGRKDACHIVSRFNFPSSFRAVVAGFPPPSRPSLRPSSWRAFSAKTKRREQIECSLLVDVVVAFEESAPSPNRADSSASALEKPIKKIGCKLGAHNRSSRRRLVIGARIVFVPEVVSVTRDTVKKKTSGKRAPYQNDGVSKCWLAKESSP